MSTYKTQVNKSIRYDEAKILGQGSFCIVYEAEYKRIGPDGKKETIVCALKMLKPNLNKTDPESQGAIKYFEQECKLLTSITHPNLVKAYEYDCENPAKKWVILEKCDMSLNQFLESIGVRILCEERVREFAISILCGLKELHSKRIVHRDLKLENILIDRNKLLKIADFGLAKQSTQGSKIALQSFLGTPDYMAPEIYETRTNGQVSYNQTVDIYAFGHVIFTLCSGAFRSDYNGGQGPTMDGRHARLFDPETYNYPASFSPFLIDLLKKCWNPDPNRRPSAVDVLSHPWIGLTSPNLSPQAAAKMSMLSTTKLIQNESNPCEYYWKPISEYMQYAVCTKVKELSLKLGFQ